MLVTTVPAETCGIGVDTREGTGIKVEGGNGR